MTSLIRLFLPYRGLQCDIGNRNGNDMKFSKEKFSYGVRFVFFSFVDLADDILLKHNFKRII